MVLAQRKAPPRFGWTAVGAGVGWAAAGGAVAAAPEPALGAGVGEAGGAPQAPAATSTPAPANVRSARRRPSRRRCQASQYGAPILAVLLPRYPTARSRILRFSDPKHTTGVKTRQRKRPASRTSHLIAARFTRVPLTKPARRREFDRDWLS